MFKTFPSAAPLVSFSSLQNHASPATGHFESMILKLDASNRNDRIHRHFAVLHGVRSPCRYADRSGLSLPDLMTCIDISLLSTSLKTSLSNRIQKLKDCFKTPTRSSNGSW